jgi:CHASE2 domain-containing sensor protein
MNSAARFRWIRLLVRIAISGFTLLIFAMHISGKPRFEIIDRVENYLYDVRVRLTMPDTIDDRIVIVDIDEASQVALGQWPWPRDTLAIIIDNLFDEYGIRVLGFDVLFAEAEETSAERLIAELIASDIAQLPGVMAELEKLQESSDSNIRFSEALIARDVVTGFVFKDSLSDNEPETTGSLPAPIIRELDIASLTVPFVEAVGFAGNLRDLQDNAVTGGFFDSPLIDSDGVFRRAPLLQRYRGDLYPSLALAVAMTAMGSPPVGLNFASNSSDRLSGIELESFRLGDQAIPVNQQVAVFIPFRGRQGSFRFISAKDVFRLETPAEALRDKIVLLGASAAGLLDLRSTPVGQRYIGVEAHANLAAGLYPTESVSGRAELCLSCHLGTRDKFATHRIMAAGHPRLSFELDTFTELWRTAGRQPHYRVDADYRERKDSASHTYTWAVGILAAGRHRLALIRDRQFAGAGMFPELGLYDCHACHRTMKTVQRRRLPRHGAAGPGLPFLNEGSLVTILALARAVAPNDASPIEAALQELHVAGSTGVESIQSAAQALDSILARMQARLSPASLRDRERSILKEILSFGAAGNFPDYLSAEQAFMVVQMLVFEIGDAELAAKLDRLAEALEDDERYRPAEFARLLAQII